MSLLYEWRCQDKYLFFHQLRFGMKHQEQASISVPPPSVACSVLSYRT